VTEQEILDKLRNAENPSVHTMGLEPIAYDASAQRMRMRATATRAHCHSTTGHPKGGIVQGGFVTGWLDAAMAQCLIAHAQFGIAVPTLELKVSFLLPAHPGVYFADGWIVRYGKRIAFVEAELRDEAGTLIARASSTCAIAQLKQGPS
jgi:uncharacterized protein (TIGR00369 family)